jgi:hypothetical protein
MTAAGWMHGFGVGMPMVERSSEANCDCRWMIKLEMDWQDIGNADGGIIMLIIVFHRHPFQNAPRPP